jgi:3-oxoacyl-[acyl-carrier protein] reductase
MSRPPAVALVTGSSRGIGAQTVRLLAGAGHSVIVNYRQKRRRAELVVDEVCAAGGGSAVAIQADLTDEAAVSAMFADVRAQFGRLDVLVLNASGGMERGADPGYAMRLNRDAQLSVMDHALPLMHSGARIVFVTSHQAHFHGQRPGPHAYEAVAISKRAGEDAIRARIPELAGRGVSVVVVSGDMIDGTITVSLLDRAEPGVVSARRAEVGELPTIAQFAAAIAHAATADLETGQTIHVGGGDYLAPQLPPGSPVEGSAARVRSAGRDAATAETL